MKQLPLDTGIGRIEKTVLGRGMHGYQEPRMANINAALNVIRWVIRVCVRSLFQVRADDLRPRAVGSCATDRTRCRCADVQSSRPLLRITM
jgi:hypothetical protein